MTRTLHALPIGTRTTLGFIVASIEDADGRCEYRMQGAPLDCLVDAAEVVILPPLYVVAGVASYVEAA